MTAPHTVTLRTQYGEAILEFNCEFNNDELKINITNTSFAQFLEGLHQPSLRAVNISLQIELENEAGRRTIINLPIPEELLDKSPAELREMDRST